MPVNIPFIFKSLISYSESSLVICKVELLKQWICIQSPKGLTTFSRCGTRSRPAFQSVGEIAMIQAIISCSVLVRRSPMGFLGSARNLNRRNGRNAGKKWCQQEWIQWVVRIPWAQRSSDSESDGR